MIHKHTMLEADMISRRYRCAGKGQVYAVNNLSLKIHTGECHGIVGESGCGKSTLMRMLAGMETPSSGQILYKGEPVALQMKRKRNEIQMIFQDPFASLDPRMTIGQIIEEPLIIHRMGTRAERREKVKQMLERVGLQPDYYNRYPHEFSGGQRQRIGIARALILNPKLIICDEPVSALDVSVQSQILNLLDELQKELGLTYIFIAHGLSVVKHISDRVGVMYLGKMAEVVNAEQLFENPAHPYTQALLSANPIPDPDYEKQRIILEGDIPSASNLPSGCAFHTRCRYCRQICREQEPPYRQIGDRIVACHFPLE